MYMHNQINKNMTKNYTIKNQDYYSKDDIQIEISEEIVTPVETKVSVISVANLQKTIDFLTEKKLKMIETIDAEIKENQDILDSLASEINNVTILPREEPMVIKN